MRLKRIDPPRFRFNGFVLGLFNVQRGGFEPPTRAHNANTTLPTELP